MKKDFDKWNTKKKYLDKNPKDLIFSEGEVWWSHFGVNVGEEAYGKGEYFRRPVVILKKISQSSCIVVPTTTKIKEGENFFKFTTDNLERRAMLYQIKFISAKRLYVRESTMEKEDFVKLKKSLANLLGISLWSPSGQKGQYSDQWVSPGMDTYYQNQNNCQFSMFSPLQIYAKLPFMQTSLEQKRHSLAHVLAAAILKLFPDALMTIGPAVENGFYYDIDFPSNAPSDEDFEKIQNEMKKVLKVWSEQEKSFVEEKVTEAEAKEFFKNNTYKLELIQGVVDRGEDITLYVSGKGTEFEFTDLCRGGHVENTKEIDEKSFMLDKIAGAYWRGDEKNKMLVRIYGLAFETKDELDTFINNRDEAKKRDHKKLGKELGLFTFSELVGPGLPLWTPKGTILREQLNNYVMELRSKYGYQKVSIPHITKKELYMKSGHWDKYKDDLFKIVTRENHEYVMKPMNCPHHTQIFDSTMRSYRDMPQRYCETTAVYRDEQSGELSGLSRVLCITQDDAHVFCRVSQIDEEIKSVWDIIFEFYTTLGFDSITPRLSRRDPNTPEKYLGDPTNWDIAEDTLKKVIQSNTQNMIDGPGEAAFYGPKIDFMAKDAMGRSHQVATIQLDFVMPKRFELSCINEKGDKEDIVMLHVAIMGSIERFLSVTIENFAGAFPLWLSPVQLKIVPIGERQLDFAHDIYKKIIKTDIRVEIDQSNEGLGKKVRAAKVEKIPYIVVIGDKEMESNTFSLEGRGDEKVTGLSYDELVKFLEDKVESKAL